MLRKIISERPENVVDYLEEFSRRVRRENANPNAKKQSFANQTDCRCTVSSSVLTKLMVSRGTKSGNFPTLYMIQVQSQSYRNPDAFSLVHAIMKKLSFWNAVGLAFTEDKNLQLALSLAKLSSLPHANDVRYSIGCPAIILMLR